MPGRKKRSPGGKNEKGIDNNFDTGRNSSEERLRRYAGTQTDRLLLKVWTIVVLVVVGFGRPLEGLRQAAGAVGRGRDREVQRGGAGGAGMGSRRSTNRFGRILLIC